MKYTKRIIPTFNNKERYKNKRQLRDMICLWEINTKYVLDRRELKLGTPSYTNDIYSVNNSLQYNISTNSFVSPFLIGCGFQNASGLLASLNIEGTAFIKALYYNYQPAITRDVMKVPKFMIKEAQQAEIKATILEQLSKKGYGENDAEQLYKNG